MKHFFLNFGEHLLLKHLVEALDRRLPALPRPLVLGLLAVDRADRRQRLGAGVILGGSRAARPANRPRGGLSFGLSGTGVHQRLRRVDAAGLAVAVELAE